VAFKTEELTSKIFPTSGPGIWMACPQDTLQKGKPCGDQTNKPCYQDTKPPDGPPPCAEDSRKPPRKAGELDGGALVLLQAQLRDRLIRSPAAARL
jgi:hypothetical protein